MQISNLNFNRPIKQQNGQKINSFVPRFGVKIEVLSSDVVSFGGKPKKEGHHYHPNANKPHSQKSAFEQSCVKGNKNPDKLRKKIQNSVQGFNPQEAQARRAEKERIKKENELREVEAKLEYEHKKAETRRKFVNPNLSLRIKEHIISENELNFIISKIKDYPELIEEVFIEPNDGELLLCMPDKSMKKTLESINDYNVMFKLFSTEDENGRVFMEKVSLPKLAVLNEVFELMPTVLIGAYTTPNKENQLPAHYLPLDGLKMMNDALDNYHAILAQIYTHTDKFGNTPMHNRFKKGQKIIKDALAFQPETLTRIRKIRNRYDEYPETVIKKAEKYSGPYEATWQIILNEL